MIKNIKIRNFKSLKDINLIFRNLNIITGINGVGKSSLIQSILLLRQSYLKNQITNGISLEGELTGNLGSVIDIINRQSNSEEIEISINDCKCLFFTKDRLDETLLKGEYDFEIMKDNPIFSPDKFQYISASRISPESQFKKNTYGIENKQFGKSGEFVVSYISEVGKKNFEKDFNSRYKPLISMVHGENDEILPLENQINYWLNSVAENVRLNIQKTTSTKYELNYEFYNGESWDSHSASNSAFGLTYSLPIIASLLAATPGDIVILENPESDLHPQAQSKLGELIARCAKEGIQVIIETHSDHILNGIRLAISNEPSLISNEDVKIFYFYKETNDTFTSFIDVKIDEHGKMPIKELRANGITGFFDQIDNDYKKMFANQNAKN
jgi:predicted ATPase